MLFDPQRHEALAAIPWDEGLARAAVERIVRDTEARFSPRRLWPTHPDDLPRPAPQSMLYWGAAGVIWALQYLEARGAARLERDYGPLIEALVARNKVSMGHAEDPAFASYLMGDTGIRLLAFGREPGAEKADELERLFEANLDDPARELMWGAPGTMLAALFLHGRTADERWAHQYRKAARALRDQLHRSEEFGCEYWTQELYGRRSTYLDAVHGFIGTALPLILGRHLLPPDEWETWRKCIVRTVRSTAQWEGTLVNWRAQLTSPPLGAAPGLVQYCHGAPGFVINLADFPDDSIDDLLLAAGQTTWQAGPLRKGANLCHGTGGNGYAFLKLHRRTGDAQWLARARAFAMHGIAQSEAAFAIHGQMRYSLWTGDLGFAIYLWDCIEGSDRFPSLDCFWAS